MRVVLFFLLALVSLAGAATAGVIRGKLVLPSRPNVSPAEAVVYVSPLPDALQRKWGPKRETFTVIQRDRHFMPRVAVVPVGSTVRFQNRDNVYHNVFSVSPAKRFDLGKYPPNAMNQVTFSRPGIVNLFCEIHPAMAAWVLVLPHRLYVRPQSDGTYAFPKLPPGSYTVVAWHPSLGKTTRKVDMPRHGDVDLALKL